MKPHYQLEFPIVSEINNVIDANDNDELVYIGVSLSEFNDMRIYATHKVSDIVYEGSIPVRGVYRSIPLIVELDD